MNRRALLAGASAALLARSAESQPVPVGGNAGAAQGLGPGPLPAANQGGLPGPSLRLDFMNPGVLDPRITFTRASTATYTDPSGTIQSVATNAPRWDYDPVTHALRGVLIEEARTNLLLQSQFDASWPPTLATLTPNAITSPDGGATAATLKEDNTSGVHYLNQTVVKAASPITYTFSVYLKQGVGTRNLSLQIDNNGANGVRAIINPANGVLVQDGIVLGTGWVANPVIYTPLPGGWGRVAFTFTTASEAALIVKLVMVSGVTQNYLGDNTSTIQLFGALVEQSAFPTSYIRTTAAAVTRAADVAWMPLAAWFDGTKGSMMMEYDAAKLNQPIGGFSDGSMANMFYFQQNGGVVTYVATVAKAVVVSPVSVFPGGNKIAGTYQANRMSGVINGGTVLVDGTLAAGPFLWTSRLTLGCSPWALDNQIGGHIRRVQYWNRALSDTEMWAVTT